MLDNVNNYSSMPKGQNIVIFEAARSQFVFNIGESKTKRNLKSLKTMSNKEILTFESTMYSYLDIP